MGASGINWRNVPHEEILRQINGGAGAAGVSDLPAGYRYIAQTLRQADSELRAALAAAGASWEGVAAEDMQTATTPLAEWADEADRLASESGQRSSQYGDEYATTRSGMPAPVPVPDGGLFESVVSSIPGVTTDREAAEAAADAAHEEAAARMEAYDNASYATVQTQYFAQPPQVVLEIGSVDTSGGPAVGSTGSGAPTSSSTYTPTGGYASTGGTGSVPSVSGGAQTTPSGAAYPAPGFASPYPASTGPAGTTPPGPYPAGSVPPLPASGTYPPAVGGGNPGRRPGDGAYPPVVPGGRGAAGDPDTVRSGRAHGARPGFGSLAGFASGDDVAARSRLGPGGVGADDLSRNATARGALGALAAEDAAAARAAAGRGGMVGSAAGGFGQTGAGSGRREDDGEHRRPDYLVETEDVWGDGSRVAPPVIGDRFTS